MPAEQCVEPIPDSWIGALIGKVSNQKLKIGNLLTFTSAIDGYLFLRMNDADMGLYDNAGTLTAQVMIQRSRAQVTIPTRTAQPTLPTPTDKIVVNDYMMLFDPDVNERPLTQNRGMADPHPLTAAFITDFESATGGSVVYRVAKESVIKTLPANVGGFTFTGEQYWAYVNSFATNAPEYCRRMADYQAVVNTRYDPEYVSACEAVARQGIDEVWEWEGGWFGFLEFKVISPNSLCPGLAREFTCMTFNYSRGVTEMLESQTHRTETVLQRKLGTHSWDQFDGQRQHYQEDYNQSPPPNTTHPEVDLNNAHCGNVHFPSNAFRHYQYDRNLPVQSDCDRWLNYPNLNRPKATINCSTGGCDRHQFLKWWLGHIPHNPGTSNGIYHN